MKPFLTAALAALLLTVSPAFPQTSTDTIRSIDVSRLSAEQKAALLAAATKMQSSSDSNFSATMRGEAERWAELGANTGRAMVGAAKEVGMAANDFAETPLGQVVTFIVVYKIIGEDIIDIVLGFFTLIAGASAAVGIYRSRRFGDHDIEVKPTLGGLFNRKYVTKWRESEEACASRVAITLGVLALTWITGLNIIT